MGMIRLERPVHYGNTGLAFNERKPVDDEYLFRPENLRDIWGSARQITERYGYDFRFDPSGDVILAPRNAPHAVHDLGAEIGGVAGVHPSAYGGTYREFTSTVSSFNTVLTGTARVDLVVGIGPSFGSWTYTVTNSLAVVVASGTIDTSSGLTTFYYDSRQTISGANPCVATLYSGYYDTYTVALSSADSATKRLDCFLLWHTDPETPLAPLTLSTGSNAVSVKVQSTMADMRNYVIVIGRRKAAIGDSEKVKQNPNNPDGEFIVRSGVDHRSFLNPYLDDEVTPNPNYIGILKESLIQERNISDEDFAAYVAQSFLYRYRMPKPSAPVEHTFLPIVQLFDPIYAIEETYQTIDQAQVLYVVGIEHRFTDTSAMTILETTSYPPFPTFQPREDVDIDANFGGQGVVNISVSYTSLDGADIVNAEQGLAKVSGVEDVIEVTGTYDGTYVNLPGTAPWPPVPGTVYIKPGTAPISGASQPQTTYYPSETEYEEVQDVASIGPVVLPGLQSINTVTMIAIAVVNSVPVVVGSFVISQDSTNPLQGFYYNVEGDRLTAYRRAGGFDLRSVYWRMQVDWYQASNGSILGYVTNNPYHHFFNVDYDNRRLELVWNQGDGSAPYDLHSAINSFSVKYRAMNGDNTSFVDPYSGECPFYDPYTSELGEFVTVRFDALVSGLYRVSVRSLYDPETIVAWLTEPTTDASDPELHWQFFTAGANRQLVWDGVDQVGDWNIRQSSFYAEAAQGAFAKDQKPTVGSGYYAWNREEKTGGPYATRALISGHSDHFDGDGKPIFGHGTFSQWFIHFEYTNDRLEEIAEAAEIEDPTNKSLQVPRVVVTRAGDSSSMLPAFNGGSGEALVYTHVPAPTRVKLTIHDWKQVGGAPPFALNSASEIDNSNNWQSVPTNDSYINNEKPVRVRFTMQDRPGRLWEGKTDLASVRLTREVHLRASIFDQFVVYEGTTYPGSAIEVRRVVSRKLTNDDHTLSFTDDSYRLGDSFKQADGDTGTEWIFLPSDFKADFGRGKDNEQLTFGDYLQLEDVPRWNLDRQIAGQRSRYQIGFINYLFYLSAYTQDRSGRFSWCVNTNFVDKSKITLNTKATDWGDDPNLQFRRTIVCRQWTHEPGWVSSQTAKWFPSGGNGPQLLQHYWYLHDPVLHSTFRTGGGATDTLSNNHAAAGQLPSAFSGMTSQLSNFGNWEWEDNPTWVPSIVRDFHGYYLVPPMVDHPRIGTDEDDLPWWAPFGNSPGVNWREDFFYGVVDPRPYVISADPEKGNTGDDAAYLDSWQSPAWDGGTGTKGLFYVGYAVRPDASQKLILGDTKIDMSPDVFDYQRTDQMVHYEDLRGMFSRGPRPAEAPKKITPTTPYYINPYKYGTLYTEPAYQRVTSRNVSVRAIPMFKADVESFWQMNFRSEYLWESGAFFPCEIYGKERLDAVNADISQIPSPMDVGAIRYDSGAWTGWKDDQESGGLRTNYSGNDLFGLIHKPNIFESIYMPVAVGPTLSSNVTQHCVFHLVLVNERRSVPLVV